MRMDIVMDTNIVMNEKSFLKILQSVDAFFPIGAFTLSNGLEDYVLRERMKNTEELSQYVKGFLQIFPYQDLGILALAHQHAEEKEYLLQLDAFAGAMKSAKEVRVGSTRMCSRYLKAREGMRDCTEGLLWYREQIKEKKALGFHPIALGIYAAELDFPLRDLLTMYGYSIISAIVNNAVKLVPLSQIDGQRVLFEHLEKLNEAVEKAECVSLFDIGISGTAYEIHCMNHEYLYSRQYMS